MRLNKSATVYVLAAVLIGAAVYFFADSSVVYLLCRTHGLDISYKNLKGASLRQLDFDDITISDPRRALGLAAKSAIAKLRIVWRLPVKLSLDFNLNDVRFAKTIQETAPAYDDLVGLISAPFNGGWVYREIRGRLELMNNGFRLTDFMAVGDDLKISVTGDIYNTDIIHADITIHFSKAIAEKIPDEVSSVVLNDEPEGWKSLSVHLSGDYRSPAIELSSKLFRLNIKALKG